MPKSNLQWIFYLNEDKGDQVNADKIGVFQSAYIGTVRGSVAWSLGIDRFKRVLLFRVGERAFPTSDLIEDIVFETKTQAERAKAFAALFKKYPEAFRKNQKEYDISLK